MPVANWSRLENVFELKTVLPNACLRRGFRLRQGSGGQVGRQADFVIEGYVDPPESLRDEGPFDDNIGYYALTKPYPVLLRSPFLGIFSA
jgi:3-polyprenyl-4-hydroxybenzoate decarboxylase